MKGLAVVVLAMFLAGCAAMAPKPSEENFAMPTVTLSSVEVTYYTGYFYFSNKVKPTKGTAGNYGAPLGQAFIFDVTNPNDFPVLMEGLNFTASYDGFDLNTVKLPEAQWIPAGKTNQIQVPAHFDVRQSLLSLLVTGGFALKAKGTSAWPQLEAWWTGIPDYSVPVFVKGGSAIFKAGSVTKVSTFNAKFP